MDNFYASLPVLAAFEGIADRAAYTSVPEDWLIGLADVVASTAAVAQGRYKAVNLAGAAVVSAIANAKGTLDFPYVFTGDGMACAVPPEEGELLRQALAAAVGWVGEALDLGLRGAVVPVRDIRGAGQDVRVARFRPGPTSIAYAMFSGGGVAWAEAALKGGKLSQVEPRRSRPDLSGLSCRFKPIKSRKGVILSMIVAPAHPSPDEAFRSLVGDLLRLTASGHPVPAGGPRWGWPPAGLKLEARLRHRPGRPLPYDLLMLGLRTLVASAVVNLGLRVGRFVPLRYRAELVENTDFRKFGDGLMMTVDCSTELADTIERRLATAEAAGVVHCGTHRQDAALMTCVVPSPSHPGHIHFVDGAGGGYTLAARQLKQNRATRLLAGAKLAEAAPTPAGAGS